MNCLVNASYYGMVFTVVVSSGSEWGMTRGSYSPSSSFLVASSLVLDLSH